MTTLSAILAILAWLIFAGWVAYVFCQTAARTDDDESGPDDLGGW